MVDPFGKRKRMLILTAGVIVLLIGSFVLGGVYKNNSLNNEVKELESILEEKEEAIGTQEQLIDDIKIAIDSSKGTADYLKGENERLSNLTETLEEENGQLKTGIQGSVQAVCCSFDEIQNGIEKNWQVSSSGLIVCDGGLKIGCGSGVADSL